ncbi:MAG: Asp-tRNA(Asn)/Glu-tRNA(Gln) amidotransferase subunit GatB [Candidatus Saccharibacteria bacterium]|nr:Asp-tRNA(Asn)/Glu-tRNA(Gln) amidotransferase subunit GatB [Candidatus Saccharibacteria bacterium]
MSEENTKYLVDGYLPTIGIECHVQLKTKTKLFGTASNEARGAEPNTLVDQVCFGLPGALPVLNKEAVRLSAKAAYALGTKPQKFSKFDRKHYFYPDLPKGYQISQFDQPIILDAKLVIHLEDGSQKTINITRAHMEEDAGKSTHPDGADYSLVDLNRAGTPLLEIVSEPELHNSEEAKAYAKELWLTMKYSGVSDVDLYHGNMRFDVNVSVSKDPIVLGTRTETKNLNSFKSVERAVDYEIKRQIGLLEKGESIVQETRGWLDDKQKTFSQRSKEDAHDYRYFPDPDIPPVVLDEAYLKEIEKDLPIMPEDYRKSLIERNIASQYIETLLLYPVLIDKLLLIANNDKSDDEDIKRITNWFVNHVVPQFEEFTNVDSSIEVKQSQNYLNIDSFIKLSKMVASNDINSTNAKAIVESNWSDMYDPETIATEKGYVQVNDTAELEKIVEQVIADNPKPAEDVKNGEMKAIGFLVGQTMKASRGKANPAEVQKILKSKLGV